MKDIKLLKTILYFAFAFIVMAYLLLAVMLKPLLDFACFHSSNLMINILRVLFVILAFLHIWGYPKILALISKDF